MYDELVETIRKQCYYMDCGNCNTCMKLKAADVIEAQDRHILTLQHEMMAEAESHIVEVNRLNKQIEELQADVRPVVRRRWITHPYMIGNTHYCSLCGENYGVKYNFCPNCGADMRELSKEE